MGDSETLRRVFWSLNVRKVANFPQNITSKASQQHIKGCSNGGQFEEAHTLVTYHRSTSSRLKCNSSCFYPPKKAHIIHSNRLHDASTYSPFRFESVYGEENALERKKYRFSPSSFSPPYGFRLPCRTVGLSCRRLQHQLSRQAGAAHFKVRNRLPGPDSCIKTIAACCLQIKRKQVAELPGYVAVTLVETYFKGYSVYFPTCERFCHVLPIFSQITKLQLHSEDLIKDKQS